jgi:hypothetical protein
MSRPGRELRRSRLRPHCHSERSRPIFFIPLRSCEAVGLRRETLFPIACDLGIDEISLLFCIHPASVAASLPRHLSFSVIPSVATSARPRARVPSLIGRDLLFLRSRWRWGGRSFSSDITPAPTNRALAPEELTCSLVPTRSKSRLLSWRDAIDESTGGRA